MLYQIKCITGMNNLVYEQRLMALKLPSLEYSSARGDMIETLKKCIHAWLLWSRDFVPCSSCMNLLELEGTLSNYVRRQYAHFFFFFTNTSSSNRVRNNGNGVPSNIVLAGTLNSFKNLDKHWKPGKPVWPAGNHGDLGSNPLRLSFLFKNCGLWTLSCDFVPCN